MKNSALKLSVLFLSLFVLINNFSFSQTYYSTAGGGPWDSTWTWVGGTVPFSYNDVVLNGPVYTSNATCHKLTINTTGTLYNNYYSYTLTVNGDVINNGSISNNVNSLYLNVDGDITNNGSWDNSYTYLTGSGYHHITCQNNHSFSGYQFQNAGTGNMFIDTEAYFQNTRIYMNNLDLTIAPNAMLKIHDGFLQQCNVIGSGSTSVVYGEGVVGADSPYYTSVSFNDISFQGVNDINNNCSTHGNIINEGFLQNDYYSYTLTMYDSFTNNGTIQSYVNFFTISCYGDFINNGNLANYEFRLYSDVDQHFTELNGHSINTTYFSSYKPSGKTIFLTDVDFLNCIFNMQTDTLIVPDNGTLKFIGSQFHNTVVYATPSMNGNLKLDMNENSYINNCHVYNPEILNKVKVKNNHFYGDILVTDTLENDYYSYTVNVHGDIVNNGVIQNFVNSLYLNIEGDIVNNGVWANYSVSLTGTGDQHFTCTNGNKFSGYELNNNNTTGDIYVDNQVYFDNVRVNFNNHNLMLPANSILKIHNAYLYLCNVVGSGSTSVVFGEGAVGADSPYCQNVLFNDLSFQGVNDISSNCSLHGTVINDGFLQNDYYSYHLQVYDDFTNNGTIQNYVNILYLDLYGNFTNNGILTNHELTLFSDTDQTLTELNGNLFQTAFFTSYKPSGKIIMATDPDFLNCVINMNYDTLILQNGGKISVVGGYMKNTVLLAPLADNGNLKLEMSQNAMLQNCRVFNPEFLGRVKLENNNFYGNVIVTDTIENNYYNYTDSIHGNIVNNGVIRNYVNSLILNIEGNLINNGVWGNSYTNMCGTADQHFSCLNENKFSGNSFTSTNSTANLIVDDMVYFDNVQVNFNNNSLVIPENSILKIHGQWLYQCNVTGAGESSVIYGEGVDLGDSPYLQTVSLSNLTLEGSLRFDSGCSFHGDIVNFGTIVNDFYNFSVDVYGNLFNHGNISNWVNSLSLNLYANITNNGGWSNSHTYMTGTTDQYIHLQDGHYYSGQMHFVSDIQTAPYQWYWDGWAIANPPYPDPAIFYGETSGTLTFLNPVNQSRLGAYYCSTGGGNSRNIIVDECSGIEEISPSSLDFGTLENTPGQESMSSWIKNVGDCASYNDTLFLYGLQAPYSSGYSELTNLIIPPGDSVEIPVYLNKEYPAGVYADTLHISNYNNSNVDLENGLVAYYPFNGNANDESGNGNNGNAMNGASLTTDRFGNANSAYYLDGVDDYIEIADSPSLRPTNLTISCWFNLSSYLAITSLVGKTVGSSWQDSYVIWRQTALKGATGADGQFDEIAFSHNTDLNQWYHIAYTYNDAQNTHSLYIDGQLVKTEGNTVSIGYDTHPLLLGADIENEVLNYFLNGKIDDVRIYDRALSGAEVHDLYYENTSNPDIASVVVYAELIQAPRELQLTALLEGPFNGVAMNTTLNSSGMIPLTQPYSVAPWNYPGAESVVSVPANVVDWVLVELRDATSAATADINTVVERQAGFLLKSGALVGTDGVSPMIFSSTINNNLYVVLGHRNHLDVMTANAVVFVNGYYTYDFTTAAAQAYGDNQNDLGGGIFGLIAGDANADGIINEIDGVDSWYLFVGKTGYYGGDANMDGQVSNQDKNDVWLPNFGKTVTIP